MDTQEVSSYFRIVRKWWWVVALLFGATVGTMLAIAFLSRAQYEAFVTLQVSAPPPQEVPLYSQYNRELARDEIEQTRASFSEFLLEGDAPYRALEVLPDIQMSGSELRKKIRTEIPENTQLVRVGVRASDPETAALLANTLVETGLTAYGQLLARPTANTRNFIEQELGAVREELVVAESELIQFQIENKIGNLSMAINDLYNRVGSLKTQADLERASGDMTQAQAIEETIRAREAELQNVLGLSARYTELVDRVERTRSTHSFLLDKRSEARIKETQILELSYIQIITPARLPTKPVTAITAKLIVLGAVVSLLAGALLTFLLEYLEVSGVFRKMRWLAKGANVTPLSENAG